MFANQLLVSTGQELTTMKLQTYPTNSSLRKQPFCETSPAARSEEKRLFSQATPTAHAASHNIIMSVLTMRISTLTPWMVVRNFCESKSAPSLEGKRKLSKSPRIILGKSTFAPYEWSPSCDSHWSLQPVFFLFRRPFSSSPHFWGFSAGNWYLLCGSIWGFTKSPCSINLPRQTHHQFVLRGHMTSTCNHENVSRQNLWADLWRQWVTVIQVYCYPSWWPNRTQLKACSW